MLPVVAILVISAGDPPGLAVFTLVRGGSFDMFVNSRRCLQDAMPSSIRYDDVAFHEGTVPARHRHRLRQQL
jgi:hypothetical protein